MSILHKSFIDELLSIDRIDDATQLDFLFDTIDYHLMIKEYEIVDEYILEFNNRCESFNLYVGFLTITNLHKSNKAKIRFLPKKVFISSVYGTLKKDHFYFSDDFYRREEIRKKKELRVEKLNRFNNL